jgi:hypothetical protein
VICIGDEISDFWRNRSVFKVLVLLCCLALEVFRFLVRRMKFVGLFGGGGKRNRLHIMKRNQNLTQMDGNALAELPPKPQTPNPKPQTPNPKPLLV